MFATVEPRVAASQNVDCARERRIEDEKNAEPRRSRKRDLVETPQSKVRTEPGRRNDGLRPPDKYALELSNAVVSR